MDAKELDAVKGNVNLLTTASVKDILRDLVGSDNRKEIKKAQLGGR